MFKPYAIDIPVALIFFARPDTFSKVFAEVKKARPSKLFLIQDGPREDREDDIAGIAACLKVIEDIDWECRVYKNFSQKNLGCGVRVSSGISWVFEHVDRALILEDDTIVNPQFFKFCAELLERYKDDERICMISGLNHFKEWDCGGNSYFFTKTGAIAAWATWKRAWEQFDFLLIGMGDENTVRLLRENFNHKRAAKKRVKDWLDVHQGAKKGKEPRFWGMQWSYVKYVTNALAIVPKHNQSCNIGLGEKASFSGPGIKFMPRKVASWFFMNIGEIEFPLKHPDVIMCDTKYDKKYYDITYPPQLVRYTNKIYYKCKREVYKVVTNIRKWIK
ncbi:hypothetical protein NVS47_11895 [Dehalobacterium formicoaceticum]|uniref:Hemolytic protein HlpA-like protein n=1 Tax=Dehalobacterium formicoaceticum TaxID=51515 RepID=A0ABT1Y8I5_9FIRM|nr:hypothetical protein [Dehalobacterium formicoaceticum]MCR6546204.1 hypothetical protein [Dehalobacterium formicoaceticum]